MNEGLTTHFEQSETPDTSTLKKLFSNTGKDGNTVSLVVQGNCIAAVHSYIFSVLSK